MFDDPDALEQAWEVVDLVDPTSGEIWGYSVVSSTEEVNPCSIPGNGAVADYEPAES